MREFLPYVADLQADGLWHFRNRDYSPLDVTMKLSRELTPKEAIAFSGRPEGDHLESNKPDSVYFFYDGNSPLRGAREREAYWQRVERFISLAGQ